MILNDLLAAVLGYLLGSIPFGLLITRAAGLGDVRKIGSGNIGATNVLRTGRRELAAATLVLDALKGTAAVLIARYLWGDDAVLIAGVAAFLGHCFPVWLNFKGGKGVATFIGILLGWAWPVAVIFCIVWLIIAFAQRYSSLSALTAAVTAPIFAYVAGLYLDWIDGPRLAAVTALLALVLIYNHRANIARLIEGTEPKIGSEKKTT
ncbi:MAG TPA: glycerol-3-phosphate 1-O-acyltransferase PlsY [Devosiaceae bacterium]|nr:glycerol-3-phosphate 1-O-acyltransferase PlsY [Devosiaceae bacterium]